MNNAIRTTHIIRGFLPHALGMLMPIFLMSTHIYFTFKLKFIQRQIPKGIKLSFAKSENCNGSISPYAALATALAATIGTGNIIGISTSIAIGGPGAVFWCWITGVVGIATCYSECFLSVRYRLHLADGSFAGGPMYILKYVLNRKLLAIAFAVFTMLASFGIGSSIQSHSIYSALAKYVVVSPHIIGIILAAFAGIILIGGVSQISKFCTYLVPVMSIFYIGGCFYILCQNHSYILKSVSLILQSAFSTKSIAGGIGGSVMMAGMRVGISKGLFTNEAGLGSIPMTAAAAKTSSPKNQGFVSMTGVFWDTVVMCAITGIVIVSSMLKYPSAYSNIAPDHLCFTAFSQIPFVGSAMLSVSLILFAFSTIIGWSYYGECSVKFLTGAKGIRYYQMVYILFIYLGCIMPLNLVWSMSDVFNSLMAIPNIICLWLLRKKISS